MTYQGRVRRGVVVLDPGTDIPEGTLVRVEPVDAGTLDTAPVTELSPLFRVADRAKATGIPDLAINHDHYLYGHPRLARG